MATLSNVKNVDMQQLEFQNLGSSSVQTVLQQPLLKNASTYTSELVSLEISLDDLPLVPEGEEFLAVGLRGVGGMVGDLDEFDQQLKGQSSMLQSWFGDLIPAQFGQTKWMDPGDPMDVPEWQNLPAYLENMAGATADYNDRTGFWRDHMLYFDLQELSDDPVVDYVAPVVGDANLRGLFNPINVGPVTNLDEDNILLEYRGNDENLSVKTRHYTSRLGMLQDLEFQVSRLGAKLKVRSDVMRRGLPLIDYTEVPENLRYLKLQLQPDGRMRLRIAQECLRDYWFRLGDGFRRLFGDDRFQFIMGVGDHVVTHRLDINFPSRIVGNDGGVETLDLEPAWNLNPDPANPHPTYDLHNMVDPNTFRETRVPSEAFYYGARPDWRPDRFRFFPMFNSDGANAPDLEIRSEESFALLEVPRRKIIVEASYPISHTTSWEHDKEKRYVQFQEFKVVPEILGACNMGSGEMTFTEKIYSAARVFLDNAGTLALKKLFEGQLQALRIDVLEELEDDNDVRTRVPIKLRKNGFMYLKWLFTKETV